MAGFIVNLGSAIVLGVWGLIYFASYLEIELHKTGSKLGF